MLDVLMDDFGRCSVAQSAQRIRALLCDEKIRLMDPAYLQREVIGAPRWSWDFEALDEGFLRLVDPFMEHESGASQLYLQALREKDDMPADYDRAVILVEYAQCASLIEDYYDFNSAFHGPDLDRRQCALLTQLKFAGQYLSVYPRHHVIRNSFGADDATLILLHRWLKNMCITWGMSRGVLLKWLESRFQGVRKDHYFQTSINSLCSYFQSPIVMAAIMAGRSEDTIRGLKEATSWLALSVKLRCERRAILGELDIDPGPCRQNALWVASWPGALAIEKGVRVQGPKGRPPTLAEAHVELLAHVRAVVSEADMARLEEQERRYFDDFRNQMRSLDFAPDLVERLASSMGQGEGDA